MILITGFIFLLLLVLIFRFRYQVNMERFCTATENAEKIYHGAKALFYQGIGVIVVALTVITAPITYFAIH